MGSLLSPARRRPKTKKFSVKLAEDAMQKLEDRDISHYTTGKSEFVGDISTRNSLVGFGGW